MTTTAAASTRDSSAPATSDPHPHFELRASPIQGVGAFALKKIRKGTRLIEYVGEIISDEEADRRYDDESQERHHTFLFSLDNGF
ncbi:MAG TPA: SET domain-containing protein, partial [Candidatus Limnocylindrales bacterium]|nr:SET domain-containing protein [Candidatus Limnocylindrales bacterium]